METRQAINRFTVHMIYQINAYISLHTRIEENMNAVQRSLGLKTFSGDNGPDYQMSTETRAMKKLHRNRPVRHSASVCELII
jgi:hypothetical protein